MKKILVVHYSQSGQLNDVVRSFIQPIQHQDQIELHFEQLRPETDFPFPWPFFRFFDTFPETVYHDAPPLRASELSGEEDFDLIVLAYQVWFLSPSLPTTAFLQSPLASRLLKDTPVVTLIACRNMWLMAQEDVKSYLDTLGAKHIGNVALVDEVGSIGSFLATPAWVMTGNKGPQCFGLIPRAGVSVEDIQACDRFGERLLQVLRSDAPLDETLFQGLGAVTIEQGLINSERAAKRSFKAWGWLFRKLGKPGALARQLLVLVYVVFLLLLIITVIPLSIVAKKIMAPFNRDKAERLRRYYAFPSGEERL